MKKLTTLLVLFFLAVGLFAAPKIPKTDIYSDTEHALSYVNKSCQNIYYIYAVVIDDLLYELWFTNHSYVSDVNVTLIKRFSDEEKLDLYTQNINTENLEEEFETIRNKFIKEGITPQYSSFFNYEGYIYWDINL